MNTKVIISISIAILGGVGWLYNDRIEALEFAHKQELKSIRAVFQESDSIVDIRNALVSDINKMHSTKGNYFDESNSYMVKELSGFHYLKDEFESVYKIFNKCYGVNIWKSILFSDQSQAKLTETERKNGQAFRDFIQRKILSLTKPTIYSWSRLDSKISDGINDLYPCIVAFYLDSNEVKRVAKSLQQYLFSTPFSMGSNKEAQDKIKAILEDKTSSLKGAIEFINSIIRNYYLQSSFSGLSLSNNGLFFVDMLVKKEINQHITFLSIDKSNAGINFLIMLHPYKEPVPPSEIEAQFKYWISQYRVLNP